MHSMLPSLAPRDPHTIWYTSRRRPPGSPPPPATIPQQQQQQQGRQQSAAGTTPGEQHHHHHNQHPHRSRNHALFLRYSEHRLAEQREAENEMHRLVTANFGSTWLKPPGVAKTLHQLREERREQEEHAEALRREHMAQELEAGMEELVDGGGEEGEEDEVLMDGARDLDEDVPEGDDAMGGWDDEDEDENDEDGSSTVDEEDDDANLSAQQERINDEAYRVAMTRGNADLAEAFDGSEDLDDEARSALLDEDDFVNASLGGGVGGETDVDLDLDMDMDANLDDDIPDADGSGLGGYEHTDSEAELSSSSSEDDDNDAYASRAQALALAPPQSPTLRGRGGGQQLPSHHEPRTSMDLSSILSRDESSFMDSSPGMRGAQARRS